MRPPGLGTALVGALLCSFGQLLAKVRVAGHVDRDKSRAGSPRKATLLTAYRDGSGVPDSGHFQVCSDPFPIFAVATGGNRNRSENFGSLGFRAPQFLLKLLAASERRAVST